MSFRSRMSLALAATGGLAIAACSSQTTRTVDSANGSAAQTTTTTTTTTTVASVDSPPPAQQPGGAYSTRALPSNHLGRIPVVEYHVIGGTENKQYTRTVASFKADLEDIYSRGYRPITVAQMLDKNFRDVPAGKSPVIFVFDDASPEQFSYVEQNGKLVVDPTSAMGIWLDFAKTHPGWSNRATFCMLNGAAAGHNFFGDNPKFHGQQNAWRFQKVQWLAQNGFELCGHTVWHARLDKFSDAVVQEQIARNVMAIDSAVPNYKVRTFALPYGIWPKNRPLAWHGTWTDPKTGVAHTYDFDAVLEVSGGPTRSPYDPQFNPHSITRIEAIGNDIAKTLDRLDQTHTRYVQ